jgi:hypothetical protein
MQPARRGEGCLVSASLRASNDGDNAQQPPCEPAPRGAANGSSAARTMPQTEGTRGSRVVSVYLMRLRAGCRGRLGLERSRLASAGDARRARFRDASHRPVNIVAKALTVLPEPVELHLVNACRTRARSSQRQRGRRMRSSAASGRDALGLPVEALLMGEEGEYMTV